MKRRKRFLVEFIKLKNGECYLTFAKNRKEEAEIFHAFEYKTFQSTGSYGKAWYRQPKRIASPWPEVKAYLDYLETRPLVIQEYRLEVKWLSMKELENKIVKLKNVK